MTLKSIAPITLLLIALRVSAAPSAWLGPRPTGLDYPAGEEDRQFALLAEDLKHRPQFKRFADQTLRPESLILEADRDPLDVMLRRTEALLADLRRMPKAPELAGAASELAGLRSAAEKVAVTDAAARRSVFDRVCHVRRQIAFANPLLDFKELLFIKRHRALYGHMCDQYYGMAQQPGGGLFVLADPFGAKPQIKDLLAEARVTNGRLKGQSLEGGPARTWKISYDGAGNQHGEETEGGSFLAPEVSYDGKNVYFAYVEGKGDRQHINHIDASRGHSVEGRCYHIFKVSADGSDLIQLTDGTWNDFDPCVMPSGRVAFNSERRGGYLRCGRVCPTFTIYDMAADGSDIRCLSFHETNEWQPSVTNEGMIIFTRWDYVDRHGCAAHQPWVMTPDGRDPRALHGNFSLRNERPDAELDVRAIPGSRKFVATAAPHHGQGFGSLVILDPWVKDDDKMAPVKRLTPDIGFPESQGGSESYGEAWPLSEDYHLAVYDPAMSVPGLGAKGDYGLYLVDSFGNRELIYRDPVIGAHSPMPLRARPMPPVAPEQSQRLAADQSAEATVGIINAYQASSPWPEGTKITALRVYQILPLSVPSAATTHNTGYQIPNTGSLNVARSVLGTVPVEEDGSVYFTVPARREIFFQALDQNGLAVTSMRSATQFQPGERAICQGCHEPRHETPGSKGNPMAMRRAPSRLTPDVDGTNPFSYPRLIQPVLEKNCVGCHQKNPEKAPSLEAKLITVPGHNWMDRPTTYFTSYMSLVPKFGFYDYGGQKGWQDPKFYRTIPGEFGARASKLYQMLVKGHHDVKLSPEDMHRLTVWLDSCSLFYGVYEKEGAEAQLRGEIAKPALQ